MEILSLYEKQDIASNPNYSIWVGASAGSGKTTILTKRLIRLLLNGAELSKIVCITFTKTGAMEMKTRIQNELEKLVLLDDSELKIKLESLNEYNEAKMKKARILFAKILDRYDELQIMTIHSFCEQIIKKFALEAKVLPNFSIIEDNEKTKLINDIRLKLFKDENLKEEISFIFKYKNEEQINSLLDDALQKKDDLLLLKEKYSFKNIDIILKTLLSNENIDYNFDDLENEFFGIVLSDFEKNVDDLLKNADRDRIKITTNYADKMHEKYEYEMKKYGKSDVYKDENIIRDISKEYEKIDNKIESKKFGKIILDKKIIKTTLEHEGCKTDFNIEVLYNAPILFENAEILNFTENWKNRGYNSTLCACPIKMKGEKCIAEIVINKYNIGSKNEFQKGYIVNITKQKELDNCLSNPKNTHNSEHHTKCKNKSTSKYGKITAEPVFLTKSIITDILQKVKKNLTEQKELDNCLSNSKDIRHSEDHLLLQDFIKEKGANYNKTTYKKAGGKNVIKENLEKYLKNKNIDAFKSIFIDTDDNIRFFFTKELQATLDTPTELIILAEKVYNLVEKEKSELNYKMSRSFLKIMYEFFDLYKQEKQANAVLDFNDLIYNTKKLLSTKHILDWVKYKLDGGIEHFLIDEAQDTNSIQWEIVRELAEEFFAGDNEKNRTLFVVGDEKQSIYGFQGAELEKFNTEYKFYEDKGKIEKINLDTSFRTLQPILDVVDATTEYIKQDANISDDLKRIFETKHIANRKNGIAKITLFPLIKAEDKNEDEEIQNDGFDSWNLDTKTKITAEQLLAESLANEIKNWFDNKREIVTEKDGKRQIKYSDIMVLLQKRTDKEFINYLLKEFNEKGLKVNGYDRFLLKNNIIIKDIIALCKVLLFSNDDFNLANIIKSPFLNMNENDLFGIFYNKKGIFNTFDNPFINDIKDKIKTFSLYEFFYYIFEIKNIRNEFQKRHPYTADEVINEFLKIINEYEKTKNNATLMNFLDYFESTDFELKREIDKEQDVITIMTAHGSKGMESPIVILADANEKTASSNKSGLFYASLPQDVGKFIPIIKLENTKIIDEIKEYDMKKTKEEKLRLLYVAMTRAENELYICGKQIGKDKEKVGILQQTWYEILSNVITKTDTFKQVENPNFDGITYFCESGINESEKQEKHIKEENLYEFKGWNGKIKETKIEEKIINPSLYYNEKSAMSDTTNKKAINKGLLVHKLLEILPPLKKEEQEQILEGQPIEIKSIISNILTKYTEFFKENSSAEVPVFGYVDNNIVSGQIDRLVYTNNVIKIIDYKNSAKKPDIAPEKYVKQLECYKKILEQIYKDKKIECYLLWTQQAVVEKIF